MKHTLGHAAWIATLAVAALLLATALSHAQHFTPRAGDTTDPFTIQCGPATLTIKVDKQGKTQIIASTGLPYGTYEIDVRDSELYLNGHMCKPSCGKPAERRC
jgi:hypothetical protein